MPVVGVIRRLLAKSVKTRQQLVGERWTVERAGERVENRLRAPLQAPEATSEDVASALRKGFAFCPTPQSPK